MLSHKANSNAYNHNTNENLNSDPPVDEPLEDEEFIEPLPFGVLSRLAHNLYSNPDDPHSAHYQEKHIVKLPLLIATNDTSSAEKAWFLVNLFIELPREVVHDSLINLGGKNKDKKKQSNGSSLDKSNVSRGSNGSNNSMPDNFKPPKEQIPYWWEVGELDTFVRGSKKLQ